MDLSAAQPKRAGFVNRDFDVDSNNTRQDLKELSHTFGIGKAEHSDPSGGQYDGHDWIGVCINSPDGKPVFSKNGNAQCGHIESS